MRSIPVLPSLFGLLLLTGTLFAGSTEHESDPVETAVRLRQEHETLERLRERLALIQKEMRDLRRGRSPLLTTGPERTREALAHAPETVATRTLQLKRTASEQGLFYTLSAREAPALEVLEAIAKTAALPLEIHDAVGSEQLQARLWIELRDVDLAETLQIVTGLLSLSNLVDDYGIVVGPITALSDKPLDRRLREVAVEAYQRALVRYPASREAPTAYLGIARYYETEGFHAAAVQAAEEVLKRYPRSAPAGRALRLIAECHKASGRLDLARAAYGRFADEFPAAEDLPQVILKTAELWLLEDRPEKAKPILEDVIRGWPKTAAATVARLRLADCLVRQRHYDQAMAQLRAAEEHPHGFETPEEATYLIGECLLKQRRPAEAAARFHEVIRKASSPRLAERAYYALGDALFAAGQPVAALEAYLGAMAAFPRGHLREDAPQRLVQAYMKMGLFDRAEEAWRSASNAARRGEGMRRLAFAIAHHYLEIGNYQKMGRLLDDLSVPGEAEPEAAALLLQGQALFRAGLFDQALHKARSAARRARDEAVQREACRLAGECCLRLNRPLSAAMAFGGVVE